MSFLGKPCQYICENIRWSFFCVHPVPVSVNTTVADFVHRWACSTTSSVAVPVKAKLPAPLHP